MQLHVSATTQRALDFHVPPQDFSGPTWPFKNIWGYHCMSMPITWSLTNWEIPPESRCYHRCKSMSHLMASLFEITLVAKYLLIVHPNVTFLFSVKPHALSKQTRGLGKFFGQVHLLFSQKSSRPPTHTHPHTHTLDWQVVCLWWVNRCCFVVLPRDRNKKTTNPSC